MLILAIDTALDACAAKGFNVGVSVVDSGGVLKVLLAKDGTSSRGVQSSTNKAVTALTFKDATSHVAERTKSDANLASTVAGNPNFNVRAGGVLLSVNGDVIGAIGVGGARGLAGRRELAEQQRAFQSGAQVKAALDASIAAIGLTRNRMAELQLAQTTSIARAEQQATALQRRGGAGVRPDRVCQPS